LKRDEEIDEVVSPSQARQERLSATGAEVQAEDKDAEKFALARFRKSDDFKPFNVIGEGDQNEGRRTAHSRRRLRGIVKGSDGEIFIAERGLQVLCATGSSAARSCLKNTSISLDVNDSTWGTFRQLGRRSPPARD
jgi:hypothetical protein